MTRRDFGFNMLRKALVHIKYLQFAGKVNNKHGSHLISSSNAKAIKFFFEEGLGLNFKAPKVFILD